MALTGPPPISEPTPLPDGVGSKPVRHLAGGALVSLAGQVALLASAALLSIVVARLLGPRGTGQFGVAVTLLALLGPAASLGLKVGITYLVSRGEWDLRSAFWHSQAAALVLGACACAGAFVLYAIGQEGFLKGIGVEVMALTCVGVFGWLAWTFSTAILLALERYESFGAVQIAQAAASLGAGFGLALPFGLEGAVAGVAASHLLAALVSGAFLLRSPPMRKSRDGAGLRELMRAARFGARAWLGEIFGLMNFRLDLLVLNAYASSSATGVYFVATSLTAAAWLLPGALQTVLLPRAARLAADAERGEAAEHAATETIARSLRHAVLMTVPTALALTLLLMAGVPLLFGQEFNDALGYGLILMPGVLALGVSRVASAALTGLGFPGWALVPYYVATPLTVALYLIVIPAHGATGAAVSSTIGYAVTAGATLLILVRKTRMSLAPALIPRVSDLSDYLDALRASSRYLRHRREARSR